MRLRTGHFCIPYVQAALRKDYNEMKLAGCVTVRTDPRGATHKHTGHQGTMAPHFTQMHQ